MLYFRTMEKVHPIEKVRLNHRKVPHADLPTRFGNFRIFGFENDADGEVVAALVKGKLDGEGVPLVRIHSQCLTGDALHSLRCDCGEQLEEALKRIQESSHGVLLYQMQEGRGIGLINKLFAYQLQDQGVDTVDANLRLGFEADSRSYEFCAEVLKYFGVSEIRLMSNNPHKVRSLEQEGIRILERVPLVVQASPHTARYLKTKKEKMGHLL